MSDFLQDRHRRRLLTMLGAVAASPWSGGCATVGGDRPVAETPVFEEPGFAAPADGTRRRIALVLSGGAARGFAHLGVLRVLEREGLRPDLIVGTSAGAMVGAMWASGMPVAEIETALEQLDLSILFDFDPWRVVLGGMGLGLVPGERLEKFLCRYLRMPIESFAIPFAAVAADMESGDVVVLNQGDAPKAVRASCSVPGIHAPLRARGRLLSDGQVVSALPVMAARRLGAQRVLGRARWQSYSSSSKYWGGDSALA
jgi:NTE family protein